MTKKIPFSNKSHLDLQTLAEVWTIAGKYKSRIRVHKGHVVADAKSFTELLPLVDAGGNQFELTADGEDALKALEDLENLLLDGSAKGSDR